MDSYKFKIVDRIDEKEATGKFKVLVSAMRYETKLAHKYVDRTFKVTFN